MYVNCKGCACSVTTAANMKKLIARYPRYIGYMAADRELVKTLYNLLMHIDNMNHVIYDLCYIIVRSRGSLPAAVKKQRFIFKIFNDNEILFIEVAVCIYGTAC